MKFSNLLAMSILALLPALLSAQSTPEQTLKPEQKPAAKWYEKISLRGYAQFRYNRLLETNPDLRCEQCDRSIGKGQGFSFRRGRMVFSGNPHERLFIYLQFDYSADASSTNKHFLQVRDAYFDYFFDKKKDFRLRLGQSKVPFGFENMQSSSNRLPLDRADALNSAAPNERDFGGFLYFTPKTVRERFKMLSEEGYKHSGDYGMLGFGAYNGQITNKPELNDKLHVVARATYPFKIGSQIIEPGLQAYSGQFTLPSDQLTSGVKIKSDKTYLEQRAAATVVVYARPVGLLAEYNVGKSPTFNPATDSIEVRDLRGGFVTLSYRHKIRGGELQPFVRFQKYEGAKKHELDARHYEVTEAEFGVEWQIKKFLEITASYVVSDRKFQDFKTQGYAEKGNFLRLQAQFNY